MEKISKEAEWKIQIAVSKGRSDRCCFDFKTRAASSQPAICNYERMKEASLLLINSLKELTLTTVHVYDCSSQT